MNKERGGTLIGLVLGLLLGLGVALAVALYVSKVPVPFIDKLPQRTADQDSAEAERNKNWNPNAPLAGKAGVPASTAAEPAAGTAEAGTAPPQAAPAPATSPAAPAAAGAAGVGTGTASPAIGAVRNAPLDPRPEVTGLFIQAGAYSKAEDAEQQRARLAMLGFSARISERDQGGRAVFRVRVGPYETREETQGPMDRLQAAGIEVSLVRVERSPAP
jgi:cell division protein FtsN